MFLDNCKRVWKIAPCVSKQLLHSHNLGLHLFNAHLQMLFNSLNYKLYGHLWPREKLWLQRDPAGYLRIVQVCFEWNLKALQTYWQLKNVICSRARTPQRAFSGIVNFVATLKGSMLGLCVVTAVSSPRFWVTHSPPTTGVLSNSPEMGYTGFQQLLPRLTML